MVRRLSFIHLTNEMKWTGIFYIYHHLKGFLFSAVHMKVFCPAHNAQSQVRSWPDVTSLWNHHRVCAYKSVLLTLNVIFGGVLAYMAKSHHSSQENTDVFSFLLRFDTWQQVRASLWMHLDSTAGDPSARRGSPSRCSLSCCLRASHTWIIA